MSIGDALAQARSQAGLTIAQVAQRTCIRETIVRDIERGDFSACGGDFYARGHIRSIARAVGVDPEELVREYDAVHGAPQTITAADVFEPATPIKLKERRRVNWTAAMVLVLLAVLGYGAFRLMGSNGATAHHRAAGRTARSAHHHPVAPDVRSSSSAPAVSAHLVVIQVTANQTCWIGFVRHGVFFTQITLLAGQSHHWTFRHAVKMSIGNPGGITLTVNGTNLGTPGLVNTPKTLSFGPGQKLSSQAAGG